jgi:poly-beta-hydroxybutyrate-responsive repressor
MPARFLLRGLVTLVLSYTYVFDLYWAAMRHRHRHPRGVRSRRQTRPGHWDVRARVERFVEPSLLLLLRERPLHGYELIERLPEVAGEGRVDVGNLYRLLRALEAESLVSSEWSAELPGPAKRTYELTDEGRRLLDRWAEALRQAQTDVQGFLDRYDQDERR